MGNRGVYLITNTVENKRYIGSCTSVKSRINRHINLGSIPIKDLSKCMLEKQLKHKGLYIDMRRLGLDNFTFEILKDGFPDNESMTNYEYEMINKYNSMNDYNILYKVGDRFKTNNQPLNENQLYYYTTFMEKSISKYLNIL